ncbi:MAG: hypothetical protein UU24_C0019G0005 [Candidatus Nomurabacteria bacterium GW2011_GWA2_40_9]|uniref:Uncharacterized protein n=1 Tax=Candidatus Nomurabacteria bacterium GW2011_GWA2_40_9 TaxID=1618734 RepID=A0A0G0TPU1_9BACT|nr:MAG: hypothetical protein UU24_C0019G0005 [Candidatus Nomurabacteria bacterium GW2011_GWA2_40_9]
MNPINENNLTEQSLIDWLKGDSFTYLKLGVESIIRISLL